MDVVRFAERHVVLRIVVHDAGDVLLHRHEDIHAYREVRSPEEGTVRLFHFLLDLRQLVVPARRTHHHRHASFETFADVAKAGLRCGELDSHVSSAEGLAVEVLLVLDIDGADHFVSAALRYFFNDMAHLAISYQCNLHTLSFLQTNNY